MLRFPSTSRLLEEGLISQQYPLNSPILLRFSNQNRGFATAVFPTVDLPDAGLHRSGAWVS